MQRQTYNEPVQWIVVDDGDVPITPTLGQTYVRRTREPDCSGAASLCRNLLTALPLVEGPIVAFVEHDDWYAPNHLTQLAGQLADSAVEIAGDDQQRYYNVARRCWRIFQNVGASLCQTACRRHLLPMLADVLERQLRRDHYGVDGAFWSAIPRQAWSLVRSQTVVGIKGLPGRPGLGIGHRPGAGWTADPTGADLWRWLGADAEPYLRLRTV